MIKVIYNKVCGRCVQSEPLTSGMVGQPIEFEYSSDFDGLTLTAVFTNGKTTVDVLNPGNQCVIPHEVLDTVGTPVKVGIYAARGNELVIPTVYATIGAVQKGADPSGDVSADPTLPVWAQVQALMGNLNDLNTEAKNNLVAAINEAAQTGDGGGSTVELDTTLSEAGKAADAKAVGERLSALSEEIANLQTSRLTTAQINALDGMFKVCAFIKDDVSAEYTAFKTAFGITDEPVNPEVTLSSISATYSGGDVAVGTAVSDLTGIVVTAHYSDGSNATVTGYTLNGTIAEGSNIITVSYGGKTTTFTVTGVAGGSGSGVTSFTPTWTENTAIINGNIVSFDSYYISNEIDCGNYNTLRFKTEHGSWFPTPNVWGNTASGAETGFESLAANSDNNAGFMGGQYSKEVWFDVSGYEYIRIVTKVKGIYNNDIQVVFELGV